MKIVLLCATRRGGLFLRKLVELLPDLRPTVFSFREEAWEPPFMDDIRRFTESVGGTFFEAKNVEGERCKSYWDQTTLDLIFSVSWRYKVPLRVYQKAKLGAFVFHDSLLPEYRGFSPTVWAIINGEDHTGVTLFEMAEEIDAGDIVDQIRIPIGNEETIAEVMERVTHGYLDMLERNFPILIRGQAASRPQEHTRATFACKRIPADNLINWSAPSRSVHNLVRAVSAPYSGAYTYLDGKKLTIWSARLVRDARCFVGRLPGRIVEIRPNEGVSVLTGDGEIFLTSVQMEGGGPVCAAAVLSPIGLSLGR